MIPINPLQQLYDLNRTSPQFHEQLSNFFRGSAYRHALSNIPSENLAWLVDHLDGVRSPLKHPLCAVLNIFVASCWYLGSHNPHIPGIFAGTREDLW